MGGAATAAAIIGGGTKLYEFNQERRKAQKDLNYTMTQREFERRKAKNLLEKNMAERRAKLNNSGVSNSVSALAASKRLYKDSLFDASQKDMAYQQRAENIKYNYRRTRDKIFTDAAKGASNSAMASDSVLK